MGRATPNFVRISSTIFLGVFGGGGGGELERNKKREKKKQSSVPAFGDLDS